MRRDKTDELRGKDAVEEWARRERRKVPLRQRYDWLAIGRDVIIAGTAMAAIAWAWWG